jgi:AcrR family transcriptional regulator
MTREVKATPARETRRSAAARATETAIVEAAARLFERDGYVATTIDDVAREAGVAVQTVYNSVGPKRQLLSRVLDRAAAGPHAPRSVPEFMEERIARAPDAPAVVGALADWFAEAAPRTTSVVEVIRQAAAVDPQVAELEDRRAAQRLHNYEGVGAGLEARAALAPGLTREDAAAIVWTVGHPEVYRMLVRKQGWPLDRYHAWVERCLRLTLLTSEPAVHRTDEDTGGSADS